MGAVLLAPLVIFLTSCKSNDICLIGDNLYGGSNNSYSWSDYYDTRPLMGTYTMTSTFTDQVTSTLDVDFNSTVYQHKKYREDTSNYIFKIENIGWVVSKASPIKANINSINMTCFEEDILNCSTYSWYAGYNSYNIPQCTIKIGSGSCDSLDSLISIYYSDICQYLKKHNIAANICMDNFEMTIIADKHNNDNVNINKYQLNGLLKAVSPNEPCQSDTVVCDSNRTYWINQRDTSYRWYYRRTSKNSNWVYGRSGSDRIACEPGYVESPLFCTTFAYASQDYTNYIFKAGLCNSTADIITECPTGNPSTEPTQTPYQSPSDDVEAGSMYDAFEENFIWIAVVFIVTSVSCLMFCFASTYWCYIKNDREKRQIKRNAVAARSTQGNIPPAPSNYQVVNIRIDQSRQQVPMTQGMPLKYKPVAASAPDIRRDEDRTEYEQGEDMNIDDEVLPEGQLNFENVQNEIEVGIWLKSMGGSYYDNYYRLLIDNGYDEMNLIGNMTENELQQIGIMKMGHRKKLMSEIGRLPNNAYTVR